MKKTRTRLTIGCVVILIIVGASVMISARNASTSSAGLASAQVGQVKRETLSAVVESSGSIEPHTTLSLNFGSLGTIAQVNVKVGDHVKQSDVLVKLDTAALDLQLQQDEQALIIQQATYTQTLIPDPATVTSTQAALTGAQAAYVAALQQAGLSSQQVTVNCAGYTQAKSALERAQTAYDRLANDHQAKNYLNIDWGPFRPVVQALGFEVHVLGQPAQAQQLEIGGLFGRARKDPLEEGVAGGTLIGSKQLADGSPHQLGALDSDQAGPGEIDKLDDAVFGEGEITDRREIVEVGVILQRHLQIVPGLPQLGVLQFEFHLMNLQFVEHPPGVGG